MKRCQDGLIFFLLGFFSYSLLELLWRKYTHWTMALTGGICFVLLHRLFECLRGARLWKKCVLGACCITSVEFAVGCVVNLLLRWDVWDYSRRPFNLLGQVCLLYTFLWGLLCVPIVSLSGFLSGQLHSPCLIARQGTRRAPAHKGYFPRSQSPPRRAGF